MQNKMQNQSKQDVTRRSFFGASIVAGGVGVALAQTTHAANDDDAKPTATIDGSGAGWRALGEADFVNVNCHDDTWTWSEDSVACTGNPVGVTRSVKPYTNFELVCEWRHLRDAGNSGIFLWSPIESLDRLTQPGLPEGIEVQVLDTGYKTNYEKGGRKADWFTCHGDVFPVGSSSMKPFAPTSPNGRRSFPTEDRSNDVNEWNHYYIRAINGEVRLWVNGREVSGGNECNPRTGYLALESEGSPIEFRHLRLRELP
jgi:hypothetical protein